MAKCYGMSLTRFLKDYKSVFVMRRVSHRLTKVKVFFINDQFQLELSLREISMVEKTKLICSTMALFL